MQLEEAKVQYHFIINDNNLIIPSEEPEGLMDLIKQFVYKDLYTI